MAGKTLSQRDDMHVISLSSVWPYRWLWRCPRLPTRERCDTLHSCYWAWSWCWPHRLLVGSDDGNPPLLCAPGGAQRICCKKCTGALWLLCHSCLLSKVRYSPVRHGIRPWCIGSRTAARKGGPQLQWWQHLRLKFTRQLLTYAHTALHLSVNAAFELCASNRFSYFR
jgi:hypothetical protein